MNATTLLHTLRGMGLSLRAEGDKLLVFPKDAITDQTRALIRNHKTELLAQLAANDPASVVDVDGRIQAACAGLPITPERLRGFLSSEDLDDIRSGDLTAEGLRAYAELWASGKGYLN